MNTKFQCYILDDEPLAIKVIEQHLSKFEQFEICGSSTEPLETHQQLKTLQPDLLFLDIEMPDINGLEFIDSMQSQPKIIITTAYREYAVEGFELNVLDYLVKPIDLEELKQAISRYKEKLKEQTKTGRDVQQALQNFEAKTVSDQMLTLNTHEGELRLKLAHILRIEGERNYSFIHLSNGKRKLISKALGEFEEILSDKAFFRCHKSHLVNFFQIQKYTNRKEVFLSDDQPIPVARRKQDDFKKWFEEMTEQTSGDA